MQASNTPVGEKAAFYDEAYKAENYFQNREWLFRPYVKALISLVSLRKGSIVLDAGCGQGFFANLFANEGMAAYGTDISRVGLQSAQRRFPSLAGRLFTSDLLMPAVREEMDCVFVRSCSLHNTPGFEDGLEVTDNLLTVLKPGGLLIFGYNTNLRPADESWINHSLSQVQSHFERRGLSAQVYLSNKLDAVAFGRYAFNRLFTGINALACNLTGLSGEAVAISNKS
jgi:SAM-dependent methyltransferase